MGVDDHFFLSIVSNHLRLTVVLKSSTTNKKKELLLRQAETNR
jgi:hypothetical protein